MRQLKISDDLSLPVDAVTRTFVVYGGKGKGKTNFGSVLCEEMSKANLRFCVTDPLDVWWGLQHGADKTRQGIDVVILGGKHGDIQIEPTAGAVIADFVADETVSTVIVMRRANGEMWTNGERIRFMRDFIRRLFVRQGEQRIPLMLVIDEAGRFVPQQAPKNSPDIMDCIGAIEEMVEWGRNVGVGVCLITQRSARMNKSVSELAECMVAFQTAGPNSIAAIVEWFGEHIPREQQKELIEALRKLPVGRALVVSPEWLEFEGQAQIRLRETFDSSATPKAGGNLRAPGVARKPDLEKYRERMAETIEKAKAEDPKEIRKKYQAEITELKKQLSAKTPAPAKTVDSIKEVEKLIIADKQIKRLETFGEKLSAVGTELVTFGNNLIAEIRKVSANGHKFPKVSPISPQVARALPQRTVPPPQPTRPTGEVTGITGGAFRILQVLASKPELKLTKPQLGTLAKMKHTGGSFGTYMSRLRSAGLIADDGKYIQITDAGIEHIGVNRLPEPLSSEEVLQQWLNTPAISGGAAKMLETLFYLRRKGEGLSRADLAEAVQMEASGGSFGTYLSRLRSNGLIQEQGGTIYASDTLFINE